MNIRKFLFEDEAVIGIKVPSEFLYIKILRMHLALIRAWPIKQMGEPESEILTLFCKGYYFFCGFASLLGCIAYIIVNQSRLTFLETGDLYLSVLLTINCIVRVVMIIWSTPYREVVTDLLTKFHLFFFKHCSEYAMKTHKRIHLVSHLFTLFVLLQMMVGFILFNAIPMYGNYSNGRYREVTNSTFEHSVYFLYPFNTSTKMKGYIFACIVNWYLSYVCSIYICMFDLLLSLMVFQIWGHIKILIHNLDNIPKPTNKSTIISENGIVISMETYTNEEQQNITMKLAECIKYHQFILDFAKKMSNVFGPVLFSYYAFHQASGCLLLLECSQMTTQALMRYLPLTLILFQTLIQLSVIFELVGSESDKILTAVYCLPWEYMNLKNRKTVLFFLMNVQEPVHLKAMGLWDVGVTSMATILKTSLSYFTFLRSV